MDKRWIFKDTLTRIAAEYGMKTEKIIREPIERLIEYHSHKPAK
jgi:hypothetical protein